VPFRWMKWHRPPLVGRPRGEHRSLAGSGGPGKHTPFGARRRAFGTGCSIASASSRRISRTRAKTSRRGRLCPFVPTPAPSIAAHRGLRRPRRETGRVSWGCVGGGVSRRGRSAGGGGFSGRELAWERWCGGRCFVNAGACIASGFSHPRATVGHAQARGHPSANRPYGRLPVGDEASAAPTMRLPSRRQPTESAAHEGRPATPGSMHRDALYVSEPRPPSGCCGLPACGGEVW